MEYLLSCQPIYVHVGNTIGRDNYKYFLGLLVTHGIGASVWVVTAIIFILRVKTSWLFIFFIGYSILWLFAIFGLLGYHVQLVLSNLTTNEHMNYSRYKHMRDSHGNLNNPFNRKSVMLNVLDALFPSKASYYSREEVVMAISGSRSA